MLIKFAYDLIWNLFKVKSWFYSRFRKKIKIKPVFNGFNFETNLNCKKHPSFDKIVKQFHSEQNNT